MPPSVDEFPDSYVREVDEALIKTGGDLVDGVMDLERYRDSAGAVRAVRLEGCAEYEDGACIEFQVIVDRSGRSESYRYRMWIVEELFAHLHKHPGHDAEDGGPTHLHLESTGWRLPTREMSTLEALEYLRRQDPREPN